MTVKGESEKARLKFNIQKMKIIACGPITSCQIDGAKRGNSGRLYLPHFQNHCSHEIKRRLLLGKKAMTNPDMPIESMMPSNHLILCCPPSLSALNFPNIRIFSL